MFTPRPSIQSFRIKENILSKGISFFKKKKWASNESDFNAMVEYVYIIGSVFLIKIIDAFRQMSGQFSQIFDFFKPLII